MKSYIKILATTAVLFAAASCAEPEIQVDEGPLRLEAGPEGGVLTLKVNSRQSWVATTEQPWITVSPANGTGPAECKVIVDSSLSFTRREGSVRIHNLVTDSKSDYEVFQEGFEPAIVLSDAREVSLANYADYGKRSFDVDVLTNVNFTVVIPDDAKGWLGCQVPKINLDRGARPRKVRLTFDWSQNFKPENRSAKVTFKPVQDIALAVNDVLSVGQAAAEKIDVGTAAGDSVALLAVNRSLNCMITWEPSEPMKSWMNVQIWEEGDEGYTADKEGRVKSARFIFMATEEELPYEVQYLTAAEELIFFSNTNTFLKSLDCGENITKLTQLRRLTIFSYGLVSLPDSFKDLSNLEYLNLSGNNFQKLPDVLTESNFPKLHSLVLNANQRNTIYDLSNSILKDVGGFIDEQTFPRRLLEWENLDTLVLSVNYLHGELPTMEDYPVKYTELDLQCDTIPNALVGTPKVLPNMKWLCINANRLSGRLPDWLLYHPALDSWAPFLLVFDQEGTYVDGTKAGFENEPVNWDYYYEFYEGKKKNPFEVEDNE